MQLVKRGDIPSVRSAVIQGIEHPIGTVKRFTGSGVLADFLPAGMPTAMSWVNLARGEEIAAHRHGESGLVMVADGTGEVFGDMEAPLLPGDMVLVMPGDLHGFRAVGDGFWGVSVQFSGATIYEDAAAPRVVFESDALSPIDRLLSRNAECIEAYRGSALMRLVEDDIIRIPRVREALLDCLQTWSDYFQLLLHLRVALTESSEHKRVALDHLAEEIGHNDNLRAQRERDGRQPWDAVMQSAMGWFKQAMLTGTDAERTLLIHLVLESSGEVFHAAASPVFGDMDHFRQHGEDDGAHAEYGVELLRNLEAAELVALMDVLENGWKMMMVLCDRMASLASEAL